MASTYQDIIVEEKVQSLEQLNVLFDEKISSEWVGNYYEDSLKLIGEITIQRYPTSQVRLVTVSKCI